MSEFTASNGVNVVSRDKGGYFTGTFDYGINGISAEWGQALREFFQHERDEELGRWRWPESPDYVVYPRDDDTVLVHRESDGLGYVFSRKMAPYAGFHGDLAPAGVAYFDAHPVRKPWHDAVEGEVWLITYNGTEYPAIFQADRFRDHGGSWDAESITAGRRIWPVSD
ncbi:hypothetical protein [Pseudactinotalea sp.]|uniref:hypothetical protein n=1 Tax=Pseudactinotalea sp. TaxID=1926260 RepID=UPI003B3A1D03